MKLISIVTSCFNESGNVGELWERIRKTFDEIGRYRFELLIIDNCSTDGTVDELRVLAARDRRVKVILNTRNFGHIRAPQYALRLARGDAVVSMVSDLQDPPEMIRDFLARWEEGWKVVAVARRPLRPRPLVPIPRHYSTCWTPRIPCWNCSVGPEEEARRRGHRVDAPRLGDSSASVAGAPSSDGMVKARTARTTRAVSPL